MWNPRLFRDCCRCDARLLLSIHTTVKHLARQRSFSFWNPDCIFPPSAACPPWAMENAIFQQIAEAFSHLEAKLPPKLRQPVIGIICGSGLDGLANAVLPDPRYEIPYADIPHFPPSSGMGRVKQTRTTVYWIGIVHGHAGNLLFGTFEPEALPVVLMIGRVQFVITCSGPSVCKVGSFWCSSSFYEGHSIQSITFPIRLMKRLGVDTVIGRAAHEIVFVSILIDCPSHQCRRWLEWRLCGGRYYDFEWREAQASSIYHRLILESISTLLALLASTRCVGQTRMTLEFDFQLCQMHMTSIWEGGHTTCGNDCNATQKELEPYARVSTLSSEVLGSTDALLMMPLQGWLSLATRLELNAACCVAWAPM